MNPAPDKLADLQSHGSVLRAGTVVTTPVGTFIVDAPWRAGHRHAGTVRGPRPRGAVTTRHAASMVHR